MTPGFWLAQAGPPGCKSAVYGRQSGAVDQTIFAYKDVRKEGLVEQTPLKWRAGQVGGMWSLGLG